jgi:hypothetical protein
MSCLVSIARSSPLFLCNKHSFSFEKNILFISPLRVKMNEDFDTVVSLKLNEKIKQKEEKWR